MWPDERRMIASIYDEPARPRPYLALMDRASARALQYRVLHMQLMRTHRSNKADGFLLQTKFEGGLCVMSSYPFRNGIWDEMMDD